MTINAEALRTLHRLHVQVSDLRERLARGPRQIQAGQARVAKLEEELEVAKETYKRTRMTIDEKELSLKEREGKILDVRGRLNSCSSNKEYQAFMEQIAADEQANSVLSDEIIEFLDKATAHQKQVEGSEQAVKEGEQELQKVRQRVEGERESLESDLKRVQAELSEAEKALPGDIKSDYERVVNKHGEEALAALDDECCGGCYQRITPQMLNELIMSKPVFCKSCGRLLYLPEDTKVS